MKKSPKAPEKSKPASGKAKIPLAVSGIPKVKKVASKQRKAIATRKEMPNLKFAESKAAQNDEAIERKETRLRQGL
jgi:hypothetical protein